MAVLVPTRVWAHRGARRQAPENTRAAFARAVELGADGVELDARHTADDVVVVSHDPVVRGFGVLAERPFAELRAARADVPTLDEALDACAGVLVNVELKCLPGEVDYDPDDRLVGFVADTLAQRGRRDDVLVSSFNLEALNRARTLDPDTPTALLTLSGLRPGRGPGPRRRRRTRRAVHPAPAGLARRAGGRGRRGAPTSGACG